MKAGHGLPVEMLDPVEGYLSPESIYAAKPSFFFAYILSVDYRDDGVFFLMLSLPNK